jgi:eukaryotic-like serine/threonine-protein kinase
MTVPIAPGLGLYKYGFVRRLGGGHFGEVWLARDNAIARDVAVKILDGSMAPVAVTLQEAQLGNRLNHRNLVQVQGADVVQYAGSQAVLIAMDYVPAGSIVGAVNVSGFLPLPRAVSVTVDILRGLEYLHEQEFLHNDIKPSNILVSPNGEALLTDYGISCQWNGSSTTAAPAAYVPHRAPETAATGVISVTTDIYQVGLTLFRLAVGLGVIDAHKGRLSTQDFEALKAKGGVPADEDYAPYIDRRLKRIIKKATAGAAAARFQSALEMRRALERVHFAGYWDVDSSGHFVGVSGHYRYSFEVSSSGTLLEMVSYKENTRTGRKTRVVRFCASGLSLPQLRRLQGQFMLAVVEGQG